MNHFVLHTKTVSANHSSRDSQWIDNPDYLSYGFFHSYSMVHIHTAMLWCRMFISNCNSFLVVKSGGNPDLVQLQCYMYSNHGVSVLVGFLFLTKWYFLFCLSTCLIWFSGKFISFCFLCITVFKGIDLHILCFLWSIILLCWVLIRIRTNQLAKSKWWAWLSFLLQYILILDIY